MLHWLNGLLTWLRQHLFASAHGLIEAETGLFSVFDRVESAVLNAREAIQAEIRFWKNIKRDGPKAKWKTRVIVVPVAIDNIKDLIDELLHGIHDRIVDIHEAVRTLANVVHPPGPPHENGGAEAQAGAIANAQAWLTTIKLAMDDLAKTIEKTSDLVQFLHSLRERITNLDDVFLPQNNPRKWETRHDRARIRE